MSSIALETFLARLYTDGAARQRFTSDPQGEAMRAGLSAAECLALAQCDRTGLEMAAESFGHKRAQHRKPRMPFVAWRCAGSSDPEKKRTSPYGEGEVRFGRN